MHSKRLVPVDAQFLGKSWSRFSSYSFAQSQIGAVIGACEVAPIASFAPFLFSRFDAGIMPYVLFSLSGRRNEFVKANGGWLGSYVPANLRAHPFELSQDSDSPRLLVDVSANAAHGIGAAESTPYFDEAGAFCRPLQDVHDFLLKRRDELKSTALIMQKLMRAGLFIECEAPHLTRKDRDQLYLIDWKRLYADSDLLSDLSTDLVQQSILHAHAVSLIQVGKLRALQADDHIRAAEHVGIPPGFEGFLDAISTAAKND